MEKYSSFQKTEIKWLSKIPSNWILSHNKRICKNITDGAHTSPDLSSSDYPFLTVTNLDNGFLDFNNCLKTSSKDFNQLKKNGCVPLINDILYSKDGTIGETALIKESKSFVVGSSFIIIRPNQKIINSVFFKYYLSSVFVKNNAKTFIKGTGIPRLSIFNFNRINVVIPPIPEQTQIAQYLDQKTTAIDNKINLLQQKAEKYKELRVSIINQAVTKGLNKNTELKETEIGIDVPKHWNRKRLKDFGKLYNGLSGKSGDDFRQENNPQNRAFIAFTDIANNTQIEETPKGKVFINKGEKQNKVKTQDLFFLMSSEGYEDIGKTSVLKYGLKETYLNSFCKGFRINSKYHYPFFINYLLQSSSYRDKIITEGKGFTRINLKMEKVNNLIIYTPDIKEQISIANYIENKSSVISKILKNIETQIDTLKELKTTLINDVVTGKIKVTDIDA